MSQNIHPTNLQKAYRILQNAGPKELLHRFRAKLHYQPAKRCEQYRNFLQTSRPSEGDLVKQRQARFDYIPCFGVVIPLYHTKPEYLRDLLDSFKAQTYPNFKLFMVDASLVENGQTVLTEFMRAEAKKDSRIIYKILENNAGIAANTNQAIQLALQDTKVSYIALCDHDDYIEPDTFFECAKVLNENRNIKIIYSDEDVVKFKNDPEAAYVMKPDFDPYLLESCNYINHFFVCEKTLLESIKTQDGLYERPEYDGAQDYDLYLRLIEAAKKLDQKLKSSATEKIKSATYTSSTIYHLPRVLYHWRAAENSTASDPHNKIYAYDAGRRALEAHLERQGINQAKVEHTATIGTYRTKYHLASEPLVSVIIHDQNGYAEAKKTIRSLQRGTYQNLEFIVVNNPAAIENAQGDILLFIDGNIEMITPDSIAEMVAIIQRNDVGVVGAKILFPNGTLQHAGVVIGLNNSADYIFSRQHPDFTYGNRANCVASYSAVTGSCLMVKKSTYQAVQGFDPEFIKPFNALDFCLKIRALDQQIVYTPYAQFRYHRHRQSKSACIKSLALESAQQLKDKWSQIYQEGDPYYNRNFSLRRYDCSLKGD